MSDQVREVCVVYGVVRVSLLGGDTMAVPREVFRLHPLKAGEPVDAEAYWQRAEKDEYALGMQRAARTLTARERTRRQLEQSLKRAGYRAHTVERILDALSQRRYLDDERYALQLARTREGRQSARRIAQAMQQAGIDRDTADAAMAHVTPESQQQLALELARRHLRRHPDLSTPQSRQKAVASLVRRGFSFEEARDALREAQGEATGV